MLLLTPLVTRFKLQKQTKKGTNNAINNSVIDLFELGVLKPVMIKENLIIIDTKVEASLNAFQHSVKLFALAGSRHEDASRVHRNLLYYRWKLIESLNENQDCVDKVTELNERLISLPKNIAGALPFILLDEQDGNNEVGSTPYTIRTAQKRQKRKVQLIANN